MGRTAVVIGATGLVGRCLWPLLARSEHWARIILVVRRPLAEKLPDKVETRVIDFSQLDTALADIAADELFCTLGTTRARAGSRQAFYTVDHDYVVTAAGTLAQQGMGHALVVTAMGADAGSRVFYNRTKGQVEADLRALALPRLSLFRPSLLLGNRDEVRPLERAGTTLARVAMPFFRGPLAPWAPIHAETVAFAMVAMAVRAMREPAGAAPVTAMLDSGEIARLGSR